MGLPRHAYILYPELEAEENDLVLALNDGEIYVSRFTGQEYIAVVESAEVLEDDEE